MAAERGELLTAAARFALALAEEGEAHGANVALEQAAIEWWNSLAPATRSRYAAARKDNEEVGCRG